MKEQSTTRSYKEMARELKLKPTSFRAQLTKLRDMELVKPTDRESQHWVITSPAAEKAVKETVNGVVKETGEGDETVKEPVKRVVNETVKGDESILSQNVQ